MAEITNFRINPKKRFYDKNGTRIKLGDKLDVPNTTKYFYKDLIVVEQQGDLGLLFVHQDFFIPLNSLLDDFFETCEIVKNKK